jgi:aldehyde:ferredoxin oxidoreductase
MSRRLLLIDPAAGRWRLETLQVETLEKDPRQDYFVLSGEALCQYLLRRDPGALVIARGPLAFLSGNKTSVGYISPLTGVPHYSFIGGRAAAQLVNLGLDAICFQGGAAQEAGFGGTKPYIVIGGRAPELAVTFKSPADLPAGQRSAFYWLMERELGGNKYAGSIFTVGEAARLGYRSANLAADAIYHAGRGGAGSVFARFASALVLRGEALGLPEFFAGDESSFALNPNALIAPLLDKYCARLSNRTEGTIAKLLTTGADPEGKSTLPAWNAQRIGYPGADLGSPKVLKATRDGQTGCHWCQVDCRHWHWVPADYAPGGRDIFLDDFEPAYATFAMLGLIPSQDTFKARLDLLADVNRRLMLPIEQMGCDVIDIGLGLAALFEGVGRGVIPHSHVPDFIGEEGSLGDPSTFRHVPRLQGDENSGHRLEAAVQAVEMLRSGQAAEYPALRLVGDGPQALAERYPPMQDIVFTGGKGTLGNPGHCNALWTFLMPFSRFFGHYSGQFYKVEDELPPPGSGQEAYLACFERIVRRLLAREFFWLLANALSQCAFTFVIFSQDGKGERLGDGDLLVRLLRYYGIQTTRADLIWFSQAFWAQSIDLKCRFGWRPPAAADFPRRVYEGLSLALDRSPDELQKLMDLLIGEWKRQAGEVLARFGYEVLW